MVRLLLFILLALVHNRSPQRLLVLLVYCLLVGLCVRLVDHRLLVIHQLVGHLLVRRLLGHCVRLVDHRLLGVHQLVVLVRALVVHHPVGHLIIRRSSCCTLCSSCSSSSS